MTLPPFLWLILIPLLSAPIVYLAGRIVTRFTNLDGKYNPAPWLALISLAACVIPLRLVAPEVQKTGLIVYQDIISLRFDSISLLVSGLTLLLGFVSTLFSIKYLKKDKGQEKYYALFLIMVSSIIGLSCAADLFNLWVWFELMAIATYTLVSFYRNQPGALEAGVKYLVQSAIGSAFVLLGIALVFAQTGELDLALLSQPGWIITPGLIAAGAFFIIGFGIKAAFFPLHTWLPDAHSQAPSGISAMLSGVVIEAGLIALLRSLTALMWVSTAWGPILLGLGVLNMLIGNLMALRQQEIKRMLAYSSIAHMGYMLVGLGSMFTFANWLGGAGAFFHLLTHGLMKSLAFLSAGSLLFAMLLENGEHRSLTRSDLNGASKKYPMEALAFSIAVLALGGLPPLAGFVSKWQIFVSGALVPNAWMVAIVIIMALNSVLSLGYYAPLVNAMYRKESGEIAANGKEPDMLMQIALVVLAAFVIVIGLYPPAIEWVSKMAGQIMFLELGLGG